MDEWKPADPVKGYAQAWIYETMFIDLTSDGRYEVHIDRTRTSIPATTLEEAQATALALWRMR